MKKLVILASLFLAVSCAGRQGSTTISSNESSDLNLNADDVVIEKAKLAFKYIPDHKRVDKAAKPYMTKGLYESLAAAWDIPDWTDGEIGNEEFLFYFKSGNDPSDRQSIESATLVSAQNGKYIVDVKYREFWGSTASQSLSSITLVLVNENGNILLDDFGKGIKQQCKQYVQEEVSNFLSGKTNQYMKDNQRDGWYTESHIAKVNNSFKDYLSRYSDYIGG